MIQVGTEQRGGRKLNHNGSALGRSLPGANSAATASKSPPPPGGTHPPPRGRGVRGGETRPRTGRHAVRSPAPIPAAAAGCKLPPSKPRTASRPSSPAPPTRRSGRTTDRDRGRRRTNPTAHTPCVPRPRSTAERPDALNKGTRPLQRRANHLHEKTRTAPTVTNLSQGELPVSSQPAARSPHLLTIRALAPAGHVFVRRDTEPPSSPKGSHKTPCG